MITRSKVRHKVLALVLAIVAAGSIAILSLDRRPPPADVFLIVLDAVRQDSLGCYGRPNDPTPCLDALAADGARFDRAISTSGWTLPAVASLLTSTWPTIHGASGKGATLTRIRDELPTAAEVLRENHFRTAAFANTAFLSPMVGVARGFDHFDGRYTYNGDSRRADETIDAVLPVIRKNDSGPNFFMVHLFDAHLDYDPPAEHRARFVDGDFDPQSSLSGEECRGLLFDRTGKNGGRHVRGMYQAEIAFMDAEIGRLVRTLKEMGRYAEATIVVVADHGEEFMDHGEFEHGHTLYDELVRVPLIVKLPASLDAKGEVIDTQVRILDVMPTIFELHRIAMPPTFEGLSLIPLILGRENAPRYAAAESTLYGPDRIAWSDGRMKVVRTFVPGSQDRVELYDVVADPGEKQNLVGPHPDVAKALLMKLAAFRRRLGKAAAPLSLPATVNLGPANVRMLKSLGYLR